MPDRDSHDSGDDVSIMANCPPSPMRSTSTTDTALIWHPLIQEKDALSWRKRMTIWGKSESVHVPQEPATDDVPEMTRSTDRSSPAMRTVAAALWRLCWWSVTETIPIAHPARSIGPDRHSNRLTQGSHVPGSGAIPIRCQTPAGPGRQDPSQPPRDARCGGTSHPTAGGLTASRPRTPTPDPASRGIGSHHAKGASNS